MTGDACVQRVTGVLKGVPGVTTESVKVGSANIKSDQAGCAASCKAIDGAGFKAHETAHAPAANGAASPKPAADGATPAKPAAGAPIPAKAANGALDGQAKNPEVAVKASALPAVPAR